MRSSFLYFFLFFHDIGISIEIIKKRDIFIEELNNEEQKKFFSPSSFSVLVDLSIWIVSGISGIIIDHALSNVRYFPVGNKKKKNSDRSHLNVSNADSRRVNRRQTIDQRSEKLCKSA